jgi:hypothetical protein
VAFDLKSISKAGLKPLAQAGLASGCLLRRRICATDFVQPDIAEI